MFLYFPLKSGFFSSYAAFREDPILFKVPSGDSFSFQRQAQPLQEARVSRKSSKELLEVIH